MAEPIGSHLRRERELRKISLEEVAEQTRIKIEYLQAIESGHFEKIPGMTFARGYLKAYADCIGLASQDVLLRFEDFLAGLSGETPKPRARDNSRVLLWVLFLLVLFGAGIILFLWLHK